jgi:hypothetical protein
VLTLAVVLFLLVRLITRLDARYGEVIGRLPRTRQPLPWLRSLRDRYGDPPQSVKPLTALEWILVGTVVLAVACSEVWFFFSPGRRCHTAEGRSPERRFVYIEAMPTDSQSKADVAGNIRGDPLCYSRATFSPPPSLPLRGLRRAPIPLGALRAQ